MANERKIGFIRGEAMYPKILLPVPNYNKDGYEWTIDLKLDDAGINQVRSEMSTKVLKEGEFGTYVRFKQSTTFKDRETGVEKPREPLEVVDANGNPWPKGKKIGNNSIVDIKYTYIDNGKGKQPSCYLNKVRVMKLESFGDDDFPELTAEEREWATVAVGETSLGVGSEDAQVPTEQVAEDEEAQETVVDNGDDELDDEVPF